MDMLVDTARKIAISTQRDECNIELTLLFNVSVFEAVIFKLVKMNAIVLAQLNFRANH
jgi:hypothetical protein